MSPSRALAFADLGAGLWGAAWLPDDQGPAPVAIASGSQTAVIPATVAGDADGERWRLDGDGIELLLSPTGEAVGEERGDGVEGFDQLCAVTGTLALDGGREVDCLGWRSARHRLELERIESFRQVAAWFEPDDGLALLALRPRGADGQEADVVAATVLEGDRSVSVTDPRLSTTYDESGTPVRAGLELWIDEPAPGDGEADETAAHQFPRRAAAETLAEGLGWETGGFALRGLPLAWHSRGRDGAGLYLLGGRR